MINRLFIAVFLLFVFCANSWAELNMSSAASMGMGNNGLAITDDLSAVFLNPAGLSKVDRWGFTSLYTRRLNEINYLVAGAVMPVKYGTIGVSLTGSQINDIPLTTMINGDLDQQNITFAKASGYVVGLAYGCDLGPREFGLSSGLKLKYFTRELGKGAANGFDLDLGVRYQPVNWFRVALVEENLLPSSAGATLNWSTGLKEPLDARTKLAAGIWHEESGIGLECGLERSTLKNEPLLYRTGLEWWPINIMVLRAGIDQELLPTSNGQAPETCNDYSFGVGCRLAGFQFDYAYKTYAGYSANNAHFFSISFFGKNDFLPPQLDVRVAGEKICRSAPLKLGIRSSEKLSSLIAFMPNGDELPLQLNEKNMTLLEWMVPEAAPLEKQAITLQAVDLDGNKLSQKVEFEIAARRPKLTVVGLTRRMATTEAAVVVKGEFFGEELRINNEMIPLNNGSFSKRVDLKLGVNRLKIFIKGEDGLVNIEEYVVLRRGKNKEGKNVKK